MGSEKEPAQLEVGVAIPDPNLSKERATTIELGNTISTSTQLNKKGWRFWALFPALWLASFLTALDATVLANSLPTISRELNASSAYIWAINSYVLAMTALMPLVGQFANIYGRKWTLVGTFVIFMAGSGICGGARSFSMFLAGRTVQGIGGAGLNIMPALVVADLVPLRERQLYQSLIYIAFAIGTFVGPVIGGGLAPSWHWIFYINLPMSAIAILITILFLRVHSGKPEKALAKLGRFDFVGNLILVAAMVAILIALSDNRQQWESWQVLTPFLLGIFGLFLFVLWEQCKQCKEPTTPMRLFKTRTSAIAFSLTFLHGLGLYWVSYYLPVYFQSVLLASPLRSGVNTLPSVLVLVPAGILGAAMINKTGRYRENHVVGFALMTIGAGCFAVLDEQSSKAVWVIIEIVIAIGAGFVLTATLTAIQAPLEESDVAAATAAWGYIQSLGFIFGAAIPSNIFNTRFHQLVDQIEDERTRTRLSSGVAYEHATKDFLLSLNPNAREQAIEILVQSLRLIWLVLVAFTGFGFILSFMLQNLTLRTTLETDYGYKERDTEPVKEGINSDSVPSQ